ncbi:mannonate dehydratase [uncultured Pelagimonas sp.]|uniref:mannonate dehydratase n=1 Tax=uncultured Pelagimonas sp. TaxID=1618102 RepID=UPI00262BDE9D|nr:mannonate dehydratase [uncultured Pelagimonas sp.]
MRQTWRWFGPADIIDMAALPQVGVEGVVSALHHILPGAVWTQEDIKKRQREIAHPNTGPTGITWEVVESLPVSETIKTKGPDYHAHIEAYRESMRNLAACGLEVICYNFMPVLDWTRTDLAKKMPHGGTAMHFDVVDFAAFDLFILERPAAQAEFSAETIAEAKARFDGLDDIQKRMLQNNIVAGLPGANDNWSLEDVRGHLASYDAISADQLRANLVDFLNEVTPLAEELGLRLCCHPDDPPFPLLGLPRIMSTEEDYAKICAAVDSPASGITYCTGSLGVDPAFDPVRFVERLGDRIHFAHLRNTTRLAPYDGDKSSFYEDLHLNGDTNMVATIRALMAEEAKRKAQGRSDWQIPMRPDHGQDLLYDLQQGGQPGYPLLGRMRGLAELRGVMAACAS